MPPLNLLIKPSSGNCNLSCKYCFYQSITENRNVKSYGMMSIDLLEELVIESLKYADKYCTFAFQGGEPTLVGLDFYEKLIKFQKKHNSKNIQITNSIQTNGMVIDNNWSKFFAQNNFLVGISLDGPKDIHDVNRVDAKNSGSFSKVMQAIDTFNKYNVEYNILTVVNSLTSRHIQKIYNFFKKEGFKYLQFIPCLDPLNEAPGKHDYSLTPRRYTFFLNTLFDLWYADIRQGNPVSIRYFDNLVSMLMGYPPESCGMSGVCSCYFVIEADGSTFPCDFYVIDEWKLGNIKNETFDEMYNSENATKFVEVSKNIDPNCNKCPYLVLCRSGCRRYREPFENGLPVLNYFCSSYKEFFGYAGKRLEEIARRLSQRNSLR
ncbi:MAG: anaerobic sulfatase maturase [Clostridiaceae bacterium]|jgi:uncharacterized protein|nr:anaerobic sulfatase maturase [Clostridiaceae bacterium]